MTAVMASGRKKLWWILLAVWIAQILPSVRAGGEEVVVLYVQGSPESKSVAEYYASRRGVPTNQILGLNVPVGDNLSRADFVKLVELPLLDELQARKLCTYQIGTAPATNEYPARTLYKCVGSRVRYLLLTWGFPYRILEDASIKEAGMDKIPAANRRNEASVDSDLSVLGAKGYIPLSSAIPNILAEVTNNAIHPTNGVFMVTRLDGPTPEIAKGLVDKAMSAETNGLVGHAYFDERGLKEGPYVTGDRWMTNAATVTRLAGYSTYVDHQPETLPASFPLSQVAIYAGWYDGNVSGPFAAGTVEFMPGAIAYHLHSFSAYHLRSTTQTWVGPLLALGATATMGSVAEPYLDLTPQPHRLLERMLMRGFTFGEASIACQSHLSWQNVFLGDPLYRPAGRSLQDLDADLQSRKDPQEDWIILRKVNLYLEAGKPKPPLLKDLLSLPASTNSAVLAEKIAHLQADSINFREAIRWGGLAYKLATSPGQKLRLLLNLSDWEATRLRHAEALGWLKEVETLRPDYREIVPFRQKELGLAREASLKSEVDRLLAELERLKPKP